MSHKRTPSSASQRPKARLLKVILLGDGGVGKSSLMRRFVNNEFDPQSFHTIGVEFLNKDITLTTDDVIDSGVLPAKAGHVRNGSTVSKSALSMQEETFTLQIWDTAGQERFKSLRTPFYRGADCCLLTYGVDDKQSFVNLAQWREEFLHYAGISNKEAATFPFVVLGNKVDKVTRCGASEREVTVDEALTWCNSFGDTGTAMPHYETSALDATNVDAAFRAAVLQVVEEDRNKDNLSPPVHSDTVRLSRKGRANVGSPPGCC